MKLPIRFRSEVEVITEQTRQFRALSPERRVETLGELFCVYHFLAENSPRREALARFAREDEERSRIAIQEFVARHGGE
jgi:hypothetical protein